MIPSNSTIQQNLIQVLSEIPNKFFILSIENLEESFKCTNLILNRQKMFTPLFWTWMNNIVLADVLDMCVIIDRETFENLGAIIKKFERFF